MACAIEMLADVAIYEEKSLMIGAECVETTAAATTTATIGFDTETLLKAFLAFLFKARQESQKHPLAFIPKKKRSLVGKKRSFTTITILAPKLIGQKRPSSTESKRVFKKQKKAANFEMGPADLPIEFRECIQNMGGTDVVLVIQKKLFKTDMDRHQGRFSIAQKQFRTEFLREEEEEVLNRKQGINVRLIEPCLERSDLCLKKWKMNTTFTYSLILNWNSELERKENQLEIDILVQLWAFRVDEICVLHWLDCEDINSEVALKPDEEFPSLILFSLIVWLTFVNTDSSNL